MKDICFIVPYFGNLPDNFQLWLDSCKCNNTVNWLLFLDDQSSYEYSANVKVNFITFESFRRKIQSFYDFTISLDTPYKICDFRPAYGEIFSTELEGYDFWGYCDTDMIFGDIRHFISEEILSHYDKVLTRGHFTLLRNSPTINSIYRKKINGTERYKLVFQNKGTFSFDEWGESPNNFNDICIENSIIIYDEIIFSDIYIGKFAFLQYQTKKLETHESPSIFLLNKTDGKLHRYYIEYLSNALCSNEVLYLHIQKRNMRIDYNCYQTDCILIKPNVYMAFSGDVTADLVRKSCKGKLIYYDYIKIRVKNLRTKINNLTKKCFINCE